MPRPELETPKTQTSGAVLANKTDAQASLERIQNFEEAFARIRSATGIEDIEELVRARLTEERCLPTRARFAASIEDNRTRCCTALGVEKFF